MSRTPIQVPIELKEQLEILKSKMHCSSLPEVINKLCIEKVEAENFARDVRQQRVEEAQRRSLEDIMLGEERKKQVTDLKDQLGVSSDAYVIDFLLDVFWTTDKIDRSVLFSLSNMK